MIDHLGFYVRDANASLAFYQACLAPLGIDAVQVQRDGAAMIFMNRDGATFLWLGEIGEGDPRDPQPGRAPVHLGFSAANMAAVDAFYAAALAHGGRDNGPPGYRRKTCYSAFAFDPDGNNIEAIWQTERIAKAR